MSSIQEAERNTGSEHEVGYFYRLGIRNHNPGEAFTSLLRTFLTLGGMKTQTAPFPNEVSLVKRNQVS